MKRARSQHTQFRHVKWKVPEESEEVILDVAVSDVSRNSIKTPLTFLVSRTTYFPRRGYPSCRRDATAVRDLMKQILLPDLVAHVLSKIRAVPSGEGGRNGPAISKLERRFEIATCASSSSGHQGLRQETTDPQLYCGGVLRRTAANLQDFGIDFTNTFPVGQLHDSKCLALFGRFQSLPLSRLTAAEVNKSNSSPQRTPVKITVCSGSFVFAQSRHETTGINFAATKTRIAPIKFDTYSIPRATRLLRHDGRAKPCQSVDVFISMNEGRCTTSRQGNGLFVGMPIRCVRSKRAVSNDRDVDRAYCIKGVHRIRDHRTLASGLSNVAFQTCQPLATGFCSAAYSNSTQQVLPCRRPRSIPRTAFLEGSVYISVESFDFIRSGGNQTYHLPAALRDRAALMTFEQIALHTLANHTLESCPITDTIFIGHSMGGQVLQSASPLLSTSCDSLRAAVFLDSRMQQPIYVPPVPNVRAKIVEQGSMARFSQSMDSWRLQCVARFRQAGPHVELAVPVIKYRTFLPFVDIVSRLALMSDDPSAAITADVDHHSLPMDCCLDVALTIRPHMTC